MPLYLPSTATRRNSLMVSVLSPESILGGQNAAPASAAWPAAQRAFYIPIRLNYPATVYRLWWLNGTTASTDDFQVGVYAPDGTDGGPGTRVINGTATLAAGASVCQYDNITDTALNAGVWWIAMWGEGTTPHTNRYTSGKLTGYYMQSSLATGLPTSATPVSPGSAAVYIPVFGLQLRP